MTFSNRFSSVSSRRARTACAALSLAVATACSGSGSSPTAPIAPPLTSLPTATNSLCVTPSTSAQTVELPSTGGVSGSIEFGAFSADASGCDGVTISTGSDVQTAQASARRAPEARTDATGGAATPLLTISIGGYSQQQFTAQTIVNSIALSVSTTGKLPNGTYYATITPAPTYGSSVFTLTSNNGALGATTTTYPLILKQNVTSIIAVYPFGVSPVATPTPSASPTASGNPTPTPVSTASGSATPTPGPSVTPTPAPSGSFTPTPRPSVTPTQSPTPKPTPTPTPAPAVYPLVTGETYKYKYSLTQKTGSTVTVSYTGTETAQLSGLGSYNGNPAYSLTTQGTATSSSGLSATLDDIDYVNLVSSGGHTEFVEYGYSYGDVINRCCGVFEHDSTILTYATPFISDMLPETSGSSWPEPVAVTETVNDYDQTPQNNPNILSGTETRNSDGSYNASGMNYDVAETRLLRSNGTGYVVDGPPNGATQWSYGLPTSIATGEVIPATESYAGQSATNLVPDWYPGGGQPSSPLATESSTDLGQGPAPSTCGAKAGTNATHIQTTFTQLDPILGFTDSDVRNFYVVAGVGYICKIETDTQSNYSNENTGALNNTKVTTTTQVLTSYVP